MKLNKNIILNEVNNLVHISGFDSVTFPKIASSLNTTRENIHHHFKTRENLGILYIEYLFNYLDDYFKTLHNSDLTYHEKFDKYILIYNTYSDLYASCPIVSLLADFKLLPKSMQERFTMLLDLEINNLKEIIKNITQLNHKNSKIKTLHILSLLKGAVLYEKASHNYFQIIIKEINILLFPNN